MGLGTLLQPEFIGFQNSWFEQVCSGRHQFYELSSEDKKLLDTSPSLFLTPNCDCFYRSLDLQYFLIIDGMASFIN